MNILLVYDDLDLIELLTFMIESTLQATVSSVYSVHEAVNIIDSNNDISCVVCDYSIKGGTGEDVFKYLVSKNNKIPFIHCGSFHPSKYKIFTENNIYGFVLRPLIYEPLQELLKKLRKDDHPILEEKYCRLKLTTALKYGVLASDIFIKVGQEKFVKVLHKGALLDSSDLERFKSKKIDHLYIEASKAKMILNEMISCAIQLSKLKSLDMEQSLEMSAASLEAISKFSEVFGFNEEVINLTHESIKLTLKTIQRNPSLSELFSKINLDRDGYQYSHSVCLAHICCGLAALLDWKSELTFYKITMASFLHDITLPNDDVTKIQSLQEFSIHRNRFSDSEMSAYMKHPDAAAEIINALSDVPSGVDIIVRQHHELPDGTGFPRSIASSKIAPLSCLFILAHKLLDTPNIDLSNEGILDFLQNIGPEYQSGHMVKIISILSKQIQNVDSPENI